MPATLSYFREYCHFHPLRKKRKRVEFILILSFLFLFALETCANSPIIRVKISSEKQRSVKINATDSYRIKEKKIENFFIAQELRVTFRGIAIGDEILGKEVWIKPEVDSSLIIVNEKRYRGNILIIQQNKSFLEIINQLPLEKYLYGVIKGEMSSDWPVSAVRAQAIASRTYALKKLKDPSNNKENYDLSSGVTDQVYRGMEAEDNKAREVVDATEGEVITYQGKVATIFYHDCCGGYTASSKSVWGGAFPYLKAKKENFCKGSPHYYWRFRIKRDNLEKIFKDNKIGKIYSIIPLTFDEGRRVQKLRINYISNSNIKGHIDLKGNDFRNLIGTDKLRSTLFKVKKENNYFIFTGKGRGHGVGMCQQGAKVMAEKGFTTEEILKFYYPGTEIKKIY